jgi:hypothetical protein
LQSVWASGLGRADARLVSAFLDAVLAMVDPVETHFMWRPQFRDSAVRGKKRCRMHGGAPGSGAPRGNQNALKHGMYTREALEERRSVQDLLRQSRMLLSRMR